MGKAVNADASVGGADKEEEASKRDELKAETAAGMAQQAQQQAAKQKSDAKNAVGEAEADKLIAKQEADAADQNREQATTLEQQSNGLKSKLGDVEHEEDQS